MHYRLKHGSGRLVLDMHHEATTLWLLSNVSRHPPRLIRRLPFRASIRVPSGEHRKLHDISCEFRTSDLMMMMMMITMMMMMVILLLSVMMTKTMTTMPLCQQ